ncbi:MAG: hypothetical protein HKN27_09325 [Silicimonas sp.]|nr:hypothetical protein [Silicimonas sp.]
MIKCVIHLWQIDEDVISLEAHVVVEATHWPEFRDVKAGLKALLKDTFGIGHITLDVEQAAAACADPAKIGGS